MFHAYVGVGMGGEPGPCGYAQYYASDAHLGWLLCFAALLLLNAAGHMKVAWLAHGLLVRKERLEALEQLEDCCGRFSWKAIARRTIAKAEQDAQNGGGHGDLKPEGETLRCLLRCVP